MTSVSIIICVFNKFNFTKSCLNDLLQLDPLPEIIVWDNASSDETQSQLCNYPHIKYLRSEENLGFGKANNQAFAQSTGDIILFLNNDIRVSDNYKNWLNNFIPNILPQTLVGPTGGFVDPKNNFQFVYETGDSLKKINYMSGWCLGATRDTWNQLIEAPYLGPWCEEYFAYFEDTHLSFRAKQHLNLQFKLVEVPLTHFGKTTSRQLNTHKLYSDSRATFLSHWKK